VSAPDARALLALAVQLAEEAGALLAEGLDTAEVLATKSTITDMVSTMDGRAERLIVDGIRAARPDDAIVGEEGTSERGTSGVQWVIDPLDGTTNYLYAIPAYAVSIGVQHDGTTIAGAVVDPSRRETFAALLGGGATRNGAPIRCNHTDDLAVALVGTGFSYEPARRERQAAVLQALLPAARDVRRFGAAALDLCWVACGRLDAYYERGLAPWDLAAGALIAAEAGAVVGDLDGGAASTEIVLASAPALFEPIRALLDVAGARDA
jgi:myo-inositol-1(or 4)-monophosphatase